MQNKIVVNAKWMIGCKIIQSLIQFAVGVLSARYLGPSHYGLINYAASLVALFIPLMELGLHNTLVQEYIDDPETESEIVGTSLIMNITAAIACMFGVLFVANVINGGDELAILVCVLYSGSLFFQALSMLQYWFQAKLLSKYSSMAMLIAYVAVSAYKIFLLVSGKSVLWFALSLTVEYGVTGILLFLVYCRVGTPKLRFSCSRMVKLFSKSKYYIVSSIMVVVFNKIGNIFLSQLCGETANGYYSAALTCTCITTFVFLAIIDTARPVILESKKKSQGDFEKNISLVYGIVTWLSLLQSVFIVVFAKLIIRILYGEAFLLAVPVLQILVWNTAFNYMGYIRNIWILGEGKHSVLWIINLCGALVSILLNGALIPKWGANGAALASVITQLFTNVIMGCLLKPIYRNNQLLMRGMNPKPLLELIRNWVCSK